MFRFNGLALVMMAALGLGVPACSKAPDTPDEQVQTGVEAAERADYQTASIHFRNALRQAPEHAEARYRLGEIQLRAGAFDSAIKEFGRAFELGAAADTIYPLLAEAYVRAGQYSKALELNLGHLADGRARANVLAIQGDAQAFSGSIDDAARLYQEALALAPDLPRAQVGDARLLAARNELGEARKLIDRILDADAKYAPALSLLGDIERAERDLAAAEAAYSKALESGDGTAKDLIKRAFVRIGARDFDGAKSDLAALERRLPQARDVLFARASLHFYSGEYARAREGYQKLLALYPGHAQSFFLLGSTHYALGEHAQAEDALRRFLSVTPGFAPARKLLAAVLLRRGALEEAVGIVKPITVSWPEDLMANQILASALLGLKRHDEALEVFRKLASLQPDAAGAWLRLGLTNLQHGEALDGITQIEHALNLDPNMQQADLVLIQHYLSKRDFDSAFDAATRLRDRLPDKAISHSMLGTVLFARGQMQESIQAFEEALRVQPGEILASQALAARAEHDGRVGEARALLRSMAEAHPNNPGVLVRFAAFEIRHNNPDPGAALLRQAISSSPDALVPRILLAGLLLENGRADQVQPVFADLRAELRGDARVVALSAEAKLRQGQTADAKLLVDELLKKSPRSSHAHFLSSLVHAQNANRAEMERDLERALELEPNNSRARLALARHLAFSQDRTRLEELHAHLGALKKISPLDPELLYLEGIAAGTLGEDTKALGHFTEAFERSPNTATLLGLSSALEQAGNREAASENLARWIEKNPTDRDARIALARLHVRQNRNPDAVKELKAIVQADPNDSAVLNDLAWLLRNSAPGEAVALIERALSLNPESPSVQHTAAAVFERSGDIEKALRMIDRALAKMPENPTFMVQQARLLVARNEEARALSILRKALSGVEAFPDKADAERLRSELEAR